MKKIVFYITLPFIYLISSLPFWLLYLLSDFTYLIIYYVVGYRKKVVVENLRNSFPNKSGKEINQLCKKHYKFFADLLLETLKMITISEKTLKKHMEFSEEAQAIFKKYAAENKSVIMVLGHYANWEWLGTRVGLPKELNLTVIYHPLSNPYFDKLFLDMRSKFGNVLITMKDTLKSILKEKDKTNITAFVTDQTPPPENAYWMEFLNQDTPVFMGSEKIAKKMNYPIIYICVKPIKRGYYRLETELLFNKPLETEEGEITRVQTNRLEKDILQQPEYWLWTHRRWKHKRTN